MKQNDKILMPWYKENWKSLLLIAVVFMFSFTQMNAQCEWTVDVTSNSDNHDEISWEMTDANGNTVLDGNFTPGNLGVFTAEAEGPLEFYISTQGEYNDNEVDYIVSNNIEVVASGHLDGGEEATESDLECAVLEDCTDAYAGEAMNNFSVCAGQTFTLENQNTSFAEAGLAYQWETSEDGQSWSDIGGATNHTYTVTEGIENPMSYRLTVTCEFGDEDTSEAIEVTMNEPLDCYCTPIYSLGCSFGKITNVSLTGESETINNDSECSDQSYGNYSDVTSADLAPGETYTLSVSTDHYAPDFQQVRAWIDYGLDGQFSDDEEIANSDGDGLEDGTRNFEFTVPVDAIAGEYRMRVRMVSGYADNEFDACDNQDTGETEDYTIGILQLEECEGTPVAGTAEDDFSICSGSEFTLSVSGASDPANGLDRIWQSSPAGEDDWTDIEGAASTSYSLVDGIEEPTDFRYKLTCNNSEETDISNLITVSLKPALECYCIPIYSTGCSLDDRISNVKLIGETETINNDSECSEDGYGDYTDLTSADLAPAETYTLSVSTDKVSSSLEQVRAWIDYNQDGQFSDEEEIANTQGNGLESGTETFEFTIPEDVESGDYRMRVRLVNGFDSNFDACEEKSYGETEDYTIEVIQLEQCEGTPTAGTTDEDDFSVCSGEAFVLSVSGASVPANGLERVWQSSPVGQDEWTDVDGANSTVYALENGVSEDTDFRYKVTCTSSDETDVSSVINVSLNPAEECYCTPAYSTGCIASDRISNVSLTGESQTIDNDSECSEDAFGDYTDLTPADLIPGETYTLSVSTDSSISSAQQVLAWIDYNNDGNFSDDEEIANTYGDGLEGGTGTFEFQVPETLTAGNYRMRVRLAFGSADFDACEGLGYGEVEDYTVELLDPPNCIQPSNLVVDYKTDTSAQISWEPNNEETEWEVLYGESGFDPSEEGTSIIVEDNPITVIEDLEPDTDYEVYVRAVCSEDEQSSWTGPIEFTTYDTASSNTYLCEAYSLTVNDGCENGPYSNVGSFEQIDEPVGSCLTSFHGTNTVWFSFVAPNNGEATITTDFPETAFNTEIVVFEAPTDCEDITSLGQEVGCASSNADVNLTDLTPGAIYYVKVAGFNNAEGEFCIEVQTDDDTPETCPAPSDIVVEVEGQSVEVTWTPGGEEDQWTVIYGEAGFNPVDEGEVVIVNDTPETTLTDLESETDYDVYVMAMCEDNDTSVMVGPENFNSGDMAVEDYLFEDFTYYPNPVKNQLTLKSGTQIESITVFNLLGQTVLTKNPSQLETQMNTESLQAGVYLMKVILDGSEKTFRIVKK